MPPTMGQGASQAFEDGAALGRCFTLDGDDVRSALLSGIWADFHSSQAHKHMTHFCVGDLVDE